MRNEPMMIWIRGAGDIATGIAFRLHKSGFPVVMTDLPQPTAIRRTICFSEAIVRGETHVEDVTARSAANAKQAREILERGEIAVIADPTGEIAKQLEPVAVVVVDFLGIAAASLVHLPGDTCRTLSR